MSDSDAKLGPLTQADLLDIWKGAVDSGYSEPLIAAGDGNGMEAYDQLMAQLARVAQAADVSLQEMYILPHSSQTSSPAAGGARATVVLSIMRASQLMEPLILGAGQVFAEEWQTDWGENGGEPVQTGRRYVLTQTAFLAPGEQGPVSVAAEAEFIGRGFNNPFPGSISRLSQPGTAFNNDGASVTVSIPPAADAAFPRAQAQLLVKNQADVIIPSQVGQYIRFTAGSNAGRIARMVRYSPPDLAALPPTGGAMDLELVYVVGGFTYAGSFAQGEEVYFKVGAAVVGYGLHVADVLATTGTGKRGAFVLTSGVFGTSVVGAASGASLPADIVYESTPLVAESATASWQVLDWVVDWQVGVSNAQQPTGGRAAMLDELGNERRVYRAPGEQDDPYRARVAQVADVVTPNAIRRAINKVLVPLGLIGCFREVGSATYFPGVFFDGASTDPVDSAGAYDYNFTTRPSDRFKVYLDELEMRAFFLIGVPDIPTSGDFGIFYDGTTGDAVPGNPAAYDLSGPLLDYHDGFPTITTTLYKAIYQAVDNVRAGGVGFTLYKELVSCP